MAAALATHMKSKMGLSPNCTNAPIAQSTDQSPHHDSHRILAVLVECVAFMSVFLLRVFGMEQVSGLDAIPPNI
jgi:hypothetical protein